MDAVIVNYRRGRRTMYGNQVVVEVKGVKKPADAKKFIGKKASFTTIGNKKIIGTVASTHGNSGALRVRFRRGLPGQAVGKKIQIAE